MGLLPTALTSALTLVSLAVASPAVPQTAWVPESGDHLVLDTQKNMGYLMHRDGRYLAFRIVTGQKRYVRYIGLSYFAGTPQGDFDIQSRHIKGDRITYGPTGRFLRMYKDGAFTHYGVHEHAREDEMFADGERFRSMGCIIVKSRIMDILDETFARNGAIAVKIRSGIEDPIAVASAE